MLTKFLTRVREAKIVSCVVAATAIATTQESMRKNSVRERGQVRTYKDNVDDSITSLFSLLLFLLLFVIIVFNIIFAFLNSFSFRYLYIQWGYPRNWWPWCKFDEWTIIRLFWWSYTYSRYTYCKLIEWWWITNIIRWYRSNSWLL